MKSQATAWGLTYFLSKSKAPALFKFYDDLSRMPRDMRLDRQQVFMTFCRDFDLMDSRDPTKVNLDEFKKLAVAWLDYMKPFSNFGLLELDVGGQPGGGPGGPGGFPGGSGGGGEGSPDGSGGGRG